MQLRVELLPHVECQVEEPAIVLDAPVEGDERQTSVLVELDDLPDQTGYLRALQDLVKRLYRPMLETAVGDTLTPGK